VHPDEPTANSLRRFLDRAVGGFYSEHGGLTGRAKPLEGIGMLHRRVGSLRVESGVFGLLVILGVAAGVAWSWRHTAEATAEDDPATFQDVTQPNESLAPEDVVRLQVDALGRFRDDPAAILQCYCLASPENRRVTGPLQRFAAMVLDADYRPLVMQEDALVGTPIVRGDRAAVLTTVVGADREISIYCFYLSKQTGAAHRGCWMTDSVLRVPPMAEPPTKGPVARPRSESV
jgi:hypothetical protein